LTIATLYRTAVLLAVNKAEWSEVYILVRLYERPNIYKI